MRPPIMTLRFVILISANGSHLQEIIDAIACGATAKATISVVVSDRKDAYGRQRYSVLCELSFQVLIRNNFGIRALISNTFLAIFFDR